MDILCPCPLPNPSPDFPFHHTLFTSSPSGFLLSRVPTSRSLRFPAPPCRAAPLSARLSFIYPSSWARSDHHDHVILCRSSREENSEYPAPEEEEDDDDDDLEEECIDRVSDSRSKVDKKGLSGRKNMRLHTETDWRTFRAMLVAGEQLSVSGDLNKAAAIGKCWVHPLHVPETGCLLIATDKLDGQVDFERTVILLLRVGSNQPQEGPFGVILNRPTSHSIKELDHENKILANAFRNCEYFYGGPLDSELLLFSQEGNTHKKFGEIIPGISHVAFDKLQHAAYLMKHGAVKTNNFRFYIGYAGWSFDQLIDEIEAGYWYVASCSATVLQITSPEKLWQKVLWLMGGEYAELSRKPRNSGL